jgi:hypothetical protein
MKRLLWGLPLALLLGCPLYDEDCSGGQDCADGFTCDGYSQRCIPLPALLPTCAGPEQCGASETCAPDAVCRPGSCDYHGCVAGYTCSIVDGVHACVAGGAPPVGRDAGSTPDAGDAGTARDAATATDAAAPPNAPDSGAADASSDAG